MSLKARIEAVIYAAEEPVTLAQLATLFRDEALAGRAARLALAEPVADPDAPTESDLPADLATDESGLIAVLEEERGELEGQHEPQSVDREAAERVASESGAQNSSDAAVATPDFAGEPQPLADAEHGGQSEGEDYANLVEETPEGQSAEPVVPTERVVPADPAEAEREVEAAQRAAARLRDREAREEIRRLLDELIAEYASASRGVEIREIAGGFRMATRPEYHDAVRAFAKSLKPPMKLSLQALETLAVIAYKQPVTAPEIGEIRGVDSGGVLGSLVARKLITTAGRKQVIGRPILYKTTKEFLLRFGLRDLNELPSLEEFEKMATELAESEDATEELPFAQNEIAAVEENDEALAESTSEPSVEGGESASALDSDKVPTGDPAEPEPRQPPAGDPAPSEPPVSEPPAEPEPAAKSEHDAAAAEEGHS